MSNFIPSSSLASSEDQDLKHLINAAQDTMDHFGKVLAYDKATSPEEQHQFISQSRPHVTPAQITSGYEPATASIISHQSRVGMTKPRKNLKKWSRADNLQKRETAVMELLQSFELSLSQEAVIAMKAPVTIRLDKPTAQNQCHTAVEISAEDDGVKRITAVGSESPSGSKISVSYEDVANAVGLLNNQLPVTKYMPTGLAASGASVFLPSIDLAAFKTDNRAQPALISTEFKPATLVPKQQDAMATLTPRAMNMYYLSDGLAVLHGGAVSEFTDSSILDAYGDTKIVDNGDGTFDVIREIPVFGSDAVMRSWSKPGIRIVESEDDYAVTKFSLFSMMGGLRVRGSSLVLMTVQRVLTGTLHQIYGLLGISLDGYNSFLGADTLAINHGYEFMNVEEASRMMLRNLGSKVPPDHKRVLEWNRKADDGYYEKTKREALALKYKYTKPPLHLLDREQFEERALANPHKCTKIYNRPNSVNKHDLDLSSEIRRLNLQKKASEDKLEAMKAEIENLKKQVNGGTQNSAKVGDEAAKVNDETKNNGKKR